MLGGARHFGGGPFGVGGAAPLVRRPVRMSPRSLLDKRCNVDYDRIMDSTTTMKSFGAAEARLKLRDALDSVLTGSQVAITRSGRVDAILVSPVWYDRAVRALFNAEVNGADGDE